MSATAAVCWHCNSTNICDCCFCGYFVAGAIWKAGKCQQCEGRRTFEALRPRLDAAKIDPRERCYWVRYFEGEHWHILFDPFFEHREIVLGRVLSDPTRESTSERSARPSDKPRLEDRDFFAMSAPDETPKKPQKQRAKRR